MEDIKIKTEGNKKTARASPCKSSTRLIFWVSVFPIQFFTVHMI